MLWKMLVMIRVFSVVVLLGCRCFIMFMDNNLISILWLSDCGRCDLCILSNELVCLLKLVCLIMFSVLFLGLLWFSNLVSDGLELSSIFVVVVKVCGVIGLLIEILFLSGFSSLWVMIWLYRFLLMCVFLLISLILVVENMFLVILIFFCEDNFSKCLRKCVFMDVDVFCMFWFLFVEIDIVMDMLMCVIWGLIVFLNCYWC